MLRNLATAGRKFVTMTHQRDINVLHMGNKIVFDIPLYFENGLIVKDTRVESGRLIINAIKRLDEDIKEHQQKDLEGCCPKK